jgi:hypothetical protein
VELAEADERFGIGPSSQFEQVPGLVLEMGHRSA